jgi:hypothetical protein
MKKIVALIIFLFLLGCVESRQYKITLPNGEQVIKSNCVYPTGGTGYGIIVTCGNETFVATNIEWYYGK